MTLAAASLLASRHYHEPVPELVLAAGMEMAQMSPSSAASRTDIERLAASQPRIVTEVAIYFWRQLSASGASATPGQATLATLASQLDRAAAIAKIAHSMRTLLGSVHDPIASVSPIAWADYLASTALAQVLLLLDAGHLPLRQPGSTEAMLLDASRRFVRAVPGCFWEAGEDDPISGIAGWVSWRSHNHAHVVSAIVTGASEALNDLRWRWIREMVDSKLPPFGEVTRLRGPFEVVTVC